VPSLINDQCTLLLLLLLSLIFVSFITRFFFYNTMQYIHGVPEITATLFFVITSANINRFSKLFHRQIPKKIG